MCGRYYIDSDTEEEIRKIIDTAEENLNLPAGDVYPSQQAAAPYRLQNRTVHRQDGMGMPRYDGNGLVINARAETAPEKPMFRDAMEKRRCVISAADFYEWNRQKEKFRYWRDGRPVLYLAGCYDYENRFVILTTGANSSVANIDDRMPVILEPDELQVWFECTSDYVQLLHKAQPVLQSGSDHLQLSLF